MLKLIKTFCKDWYLYHRIKFVSFDDIGIALGKNHNSESVLYNFKTLGFYVHSAKYTGKDKIHYTGFALGNHKISTCIAKKIFVYIDNKHKQRGE